MFKFIKKVFSEAVVKVNEQELTGWQRIFTLILAIIVVALALGLVGLIVAGFGAIFVVGVVAMLCVVPVLLLIEGIRQMVSVAKSLNNLRKKKKELQKKQSEHLKKMEEYYIEKRESINSTLELLDNSKSTIKDELGEEVVAQELVPFSLDDMEAYVKYVAEINPVDAEMLAANMVMIAQIKNQMEAIQNPLMREQLQRKYESMLFDFQDLVSKYVDQINNMNSKFESKKQRRLFK